MCILAAIHPADSTRAILECLGLGLTGDETGTQIARMHVIRHGDDIGEGDHPVVSGLHLAFERGTGSHAHVVFDGRDLGPGMNLLLEGDHVAFVRMDSAAATSAKLPSNLADLIGYARSADRVIYDGRDLGPGLSPQFVAAPHRESGSVLRN
jgi:hypothetical protein